MSAASGSGQLPLALRFAPDQRFETFVAADAAMLSALRALAAGMDMRNVFVAGPAGSGKTHLCIAACAEAEARGRSAAYVPLGAVVGRVRDALDGLHLNQLVALDGLESLAGDRDAEIALFALHNRLHDAGHALLYTAQGWPEALGLTLPDLQSRLSQGPRIALAPLDDAGRARMLRLRAERRGLQFDDAAIEWLLRRVGRDLSTLAAFFERLDRAALAAQRRITVPFLRQVLGDVSA